MLSNNQTLHKGRYRVIESFSQDGSSGMYQAYDTFSNTNVILRESVGDLGSTPTQLDAINAAFAGGAKVLTEIKHESLVTVQDYFSDVDRQYLVLEPVTGADLTKFLQPDAERPGLEVVLSWADQLLGALQYLHKNSPPLTHLDITPENIKLTSTRQVKLLTAAVTVNADGSSVSFASAQPGDNSAFHYRPLEQLWPELNSATQRVILNSYDEKSAGLLTQPLDPRSDIYSLAASLYHVLTGTLPVDALDRSITILDGNPDPLQSLSELDASIPTDISDMFMTAMSLSRENRYDSASIMSQILRSAAARVDVRATKPQPAMPTFDKASEAPIDLERNDVFARNLELETEQARLTEEQNRIDLRRQELADETERLTRAEKQAEQEAKQQRQEVQRALAAAEAASKQNLAADHANEEELNLLEITAVPGFVQADEHFELHEDALFEDDKEEVVATNAASTRRSEDVSYAPSFESQTTSAPKWKVPAMVAAAAVALAVVFGGWKYMSSASTPTAQPPVQTAVQPEQAAVPPTSSEQPAADQTVAVQPQTTNGVAANTAEPTVEQPAATVEKTRQTQGETAAEKAKKQAVTPAKTPAPAAKKKVTVDDLINDN